MVIPKTRQTNSSTLKVSLTKTTIHVNISIILHVKGDFLPEKKKFTSRQLQPHLVQTENEKFYENGLLIPFFRGGKKPNTLPIPLHTNAKIQ